MSILMKKDKGLIRQYTVQYSVLLPELNKILEAFTAMNIGVLDFETFKKAIINPEEIVFDMLTKGEPVTIMGFAVDKKKAMEIIVKPIGFDNFLETIAAFKSKPNYNYYLSLVDITENQVILSTKTLEMIDSVSSIYAETEKEILVFNFAKAFIDLANTMFGNSAGTFDIGKMIYEIIYFKNDACGKAWEISSDKIKQFNNRI